MRGMGNMQGLMKQVQKMQKDLEKEQAAIEATEYEAQDNNQLVKVVVTGKGDLVDLSIDPALIDPEDAEMLEDVVLATVNEALTKANQDKEERLGRFTKGMNLPF